MVPQHLRETDAALDYAGAWGDGQALREMEDAEPAQIAMTISWPCIHHDSMVVPMEVQWKPNGSPMEASMEAQWKPTKLSVFDGVVRTQKNIDNVVLLSHHHRTVPNTEFCRLPLGLPLRLPLGFHWASIGLPLSRHRHGRGGSFSVLEKT